MVPFCDEVALWVVDSVPPGRVFATEGEGLAQIVEVNVIIIHVAPPSLGLNDQTREKLYMNINLLLTHDFGSFMHCEIYGESMITTRISPLITTSNHNNKITKLLISLP